MAKRRFVGKAVTMRVKEIARCANVSADTVRFYSRERLLRPRQNLRNGYYVYGSEDLRRLRFIREAHKLGLGLEEVKTILTQTTEDGLSNNELKKLFTDRLSRLEQHLIELERLRDDMRASVDVWKHLPEAAPDGYSVQQLIRQWS
ncbi:MerR family transcriptional regulator [Marinobacter algicola]|nr:MerR family transcriptional regulator [Marinobacter algicola]